jgi:hypothetical protein
MSPHAVVGGLAGAGDAHRSDRWPQRAPASDARPPTRGGRGAGAAPHQAAPRSGFRRCFVPTPITGRGRRTQRDRKLLDSSKGRATTGERPEVGFDLRERGSRCDQVCADGRDLPCGDAFPSGGTGGPAPVVEQVAYLRQHWKRATRYARNPCRVSGAMAYALRGTCGTTWCDRPCGDNSRSGMDGHGRGSATIYARRGTGFSVGAGERRVGPDSGDSRRLLRPPMRARGQIKRD